MGGDLQTRMYGQKKASAVAKRMGGYNNEPLHKMGHYNSPVKRLGHSNGVSAATNMQMPEIRPV
jgi:hypothetical protein